MASPARWTWVWTSCGGWWWTVHRGAESDIPNNWTTTTATSFRPPLWSHSLVRGTLWSGACSDYFSGPPFGLHGISHFASGIKYLLLEGRLLKAECVLLTTVSPASNTAPGSYSALIWMKDAGEHEWTQWLEALVCWHCPAGAAFVELGIAPYQLTSLLTKYPHSCCAPGLIISWCWVESQSVGRSVMSDSLWPHGL